ncbi:Heat shock protein HslJ [Roseovarius pacificus]|uniref:Heat shock protein HslJ n=1 Tax=Roseovarius pacificus TaxID=337701 RepID=A0A1M7BHM1_9RHOB|nr:META domain-containing protein [Roseovarius pacificus]GGO55105.1 HslJ [Roseovarius pacificus]SHL54366.1 Heat shock protein HslJ [Roseovarius pacificus]
MFRLALSAALTLGVTSAALAQEDTRQITGQLIYLQKIALPPGAKVTVSAQGAFGTELDLARFETTGQQVPLPFELTVPKGLSGEVSAVIRMKDQPWWIVQDIPFGAGNTPVDLGDLRLERFTPLAFATRFDCDGTEVQFGVADDRAILRVSGQDFEMVPAISASGARYVSKGDESTEFWSKGDMAMLTVAGEEMPECTRISDDAAAYRAGGNEPGWYVSIGKTEIDVVADYGELTRSAQRPDVQVMPGAYVFDMPDIRTRLTIEDRMCHDDATGMPHPHRATLDLDERSLHGCGGDPASLLTGREWRIEDVAGQGIIDASNITILFDRNERVSGSTGCNRFMGGYELTGEGLNLGQMGATMMACPEALMKQEQRVLDALQQVRRFDIDDTGALVLIGGSEDAPLLTGRRP